MSRGLKLGIRLADEVAEQRWRPGHKLAASVACMELCKENEGVCGDGSVCFFFKKIML
jgi:hypothetical protein